VKKTSASTSTWSATGESSAKKLKTKAIAYKVLTSGWNGPTISCRSAQTRFSMNVQGLHPAQ
jgi:hypothetical protein